VVARGRPGTGAEPHHVGDARRIIASDQFTAINLDLQVKTMVAQQQRRWRARLTTITRELGGPRKAGTSRAGLEDIGLGRISEDVTERLCLACD
jgi:hypothetical protein